MRNISASCSHSSSPSESSGPPASYLMDAARSPTHTGALMRLALFAGLLVAAPLIAQQPAPTPPPPQPAFATDSAAVMQVVKNLFNGMRTRDTTLMRAQFHVAAEMRSASYDRTAKAVIQGDTPTDWLSGVATAPVDLLLDERLGTPVLHVDGNLATVWVYYEFWAGDRFSHCGADLFTFGRTTDGWKVIFVADSRRRGPGCAQNLPKGS